MFCYKIPLVHHIPIEQSVDIIALLDYVNNQLATSERTDQACFKAGILYHLQY